MHRIKKEPSTGHINKIESSKILNRMSNLEVKMNKMMSLLENVDFSALTSPRSDSGSELKQGPETSQFSDDPSAVQEQEHLSTDQKSLPKNWTVHVDPKSNKLFFQNVVSQEVQWDFPDSTTEK